MKKVIGFISILTTCSALMFADISAKKLDDGSIEATFFYGNPRATEVLVAGDFTDWQNAALPMEKGEKGFTLVKKEKGNTDYNYYYASPDGDTLNIGDQGAVGFGIHASFSTEQIGRQAKEQAFSRGFSCEPDSDIYSDLHHCFLWIFDNTGMWIYGREGE